MSGVTLVVVDVVTEEGKAPTPDILPPPAPLMLLESW